MEGLIDLELATELDRKVYLAFLRGLTKIKFRSQFRKEELLKQRVGAEEGAEPEEEIDLEWIYTNLFGSTGIQGDQFNQLVESSLRLLSEIVSLNMEKEQLEQYLNRKVSAREETKKAISIFWKQERANIIRAIRAPTANETDGIADLDWQIHLATAGRHQPKVNQQSATMVIQPRNGDHRDRVMFEVSKADVSLMLDKLRILDQIVGAPEQQ